MSSAAANSTQISELSNNYDSTRFVDRERELNYIAGLCDAAATPGGTSSGVVNFWGIKGSGKTWLLHRLKDRYQYRPPQFPYQKPTLTAYFSFEQNKGVRPAEAARALAHAFSAQVLRQINHIISEAEKQLLESVQETGALDSFVRVFRQLTDNFAPLLMLDTCENISSDVWREIELEIIEPLVRTNRVIFVVAGRQYVRQWHRFEVRRRVASFTNTLVSPFNKETALQQIQRGNYQLDRSPELFVEEVYRYSGGNPFMVDLFARSARTRSDIVRLINENEATLLGIGKDWRPLIEQLAPLRFYRGDSLRFMLAVDNSEEESRPDNYYLSILRDLDAASEVVWWDHGKKAYVTSPPVRQMINLRQSLEERTRDSFVAQHRQAIAMYRSQLEKYPRTSDDYVLEIWFHLANIYLATEGREGLEKELQDVLPLVDPLDSDSTNSLQKALEADQELLDLLPTEMSQLLLQELKNRLEK